MSNEYKTTTPETSFTCEALGTPADVRLIDVEANAVVITQGLQARVTHLARVAGPPFLALAHVPVHPILARALVLTRVAEALVDVGLAKPT